MMVLVANLGSTSFKFKLFEIDDGDERLLADGAADRIGQGASHWSVRSGESSRTGEADLPDHAAAIDLLLGELSAAGCEQIDELDAIGFKAVHGGPISGAVTVDEQVIETMRQFSDVAPAHNPPYLAAMHAFQQKRPDVAQVAVFETAFHQTIPPARQVYGIPYEWVELGVRRYGFHGASNTSVARRLAALAPGVRKIINFHLGGSCSVGAIRDGRSVAHSMGATPQSGLFHADRVGDFDVFALRKLLARGLTVEQIFDRLSHDGGLKGLSGVSADLREVKAAADQGNERAQLAIDAFIEAARHYLGAFLVVLGGADALCFTAGIGQHNPWLRRAICRDLQWAGIALDERLNDRADGNQATRLSAADAPVQIWIVPADEESIVARQTYEVLQASATGGLANPGTTND